VLLRLAVLVDAPAAIEEAVALVLGTQIDELRRAACLAYIHRLYSAFIVTQPTPMPHGLPGYMWQYEAAINIGTPPRACTSNARPPAGRLHGVWSFRDRP
jgi:hypothetical protein